MKKISSRNKRFIQWFFIRPAAILAILIIIVSLSAFFTGCSRNKIRETSASAETQDQQATQTSGTENISGSTAAESAKEPEGSETSKKETETTAAATETTEAIPAEITQLIKSANSYYSNGEYGLAKSTYRKADIAIGSSALSENAKKKLKDSFGAKYNKAKDIIETATMHYANAMQFQYEQRYNEAKKELEAALAVYPKYAEAQEAYESLKAVMGLV